MFDVNVAIVLIVRLVGARRLRRAHRRRARRRQRARHLSGDRQLPRRHSACWARPAYEALRDYVFAVIPLFMLMGEFIGRSGAVTDVYKGINRGCADTRQTGNRHRARQRAVFLRHRRQHRQRGRVLAHRLSGDEAARLRPRLRARHHGRLLLPRHADPAERADDRLGHSDGEIDRSDLSRRRASPA